MDEYLINACNAGYLKEVKLLIERDKLSVNCKTKNGCTPLTESCHKGHVEIVKYLLSKDDINVNLPVANSCETPLIIAFRFKHLECVKLLLNHPDIDVNKYSLGNSPLGFALMFDKEIFDLLLNRPDIEVTIEHVLLAQKIAASGVCIDDCDKILKKYIKSVKMDD